MTKQLVDLAGDINKEHKLAVYAAKSAIEHARRCGQLLIQAKQQIGHGGFLKWLADDCQVGERQAQNYMRVAEHWEAIQDKSEPGADLTLKGALRLLDGRGAHVANNSGNNEWYTPPQYIAAAREVMGEIELDPATSPAAQKAIQANRYYTIDDDGLQHEWVGRVWMNPPYAQPAIVNFADKLAKSFASGEVPEAIALVNNATDAKWFVTLATVASAFCFTAGRIRFIDNAGEPKGAPLQGQCLIYLGSRPQRFVDRFSGFGTVLIKPAAERMHG